MRLWDRKEDGGFPEVKELKRRVRDVVSPDRNLGHNEKGGERGTVTGKLLPEGDQQEEQQAMKASQESRVIGTDARSKDSKGQSCEDCTSNVNLDSEV